MSDDIRSVFRLLMAFLVGSGAGAASASVPADGQSPDTVSQVAAAPPGTLQVAQGNSVQDLQQFLQLYSTGSSGAAAAAPPPRTRRAPAAAAPPPRERAAY